jgi:RNA polymerase sigma factor (sigma-70 family)
MDVSASSVLGELSPTSLHASRPAQLQQACSPEAAETDQRLMERYRAGDSKAFNELYRRFRAPLRRFVAKLSPEPEDAGEIVQEVWLAIIRGARSYRPGAKFATYLFSIAHRRLQDRWRTRGRRTQAFTDDPQIAPDPEQIADDARALPEAWAARAQLRNALLAALDQLPPPQRAVFLLKAEADLSLEEIAAATGAGLEATKSRMRYAVARLRAQLANWNGEETRST